jgi:hypothetical protein
MVVPFEPSRTLVLPVAYIVRYRATRYVGTRATCGQSTEKIARMFAEGSRSRTFVLGRDFLLNRLLEDFGAAHRGSLPRA